MVIQIALITEVKCSISVFSDIIRIGSNIWTGLPYWDRPESHNENIGLENGLGLQKFPIC